MPPDDMITYGEVVAITMRKYKCSRAAERFVQQFMLEHEAIHYRKLSWRARSSSRQREACFASMLLEKERDELGPRRPAPERCWSD
jgi:hypothetical protein